ncbi:hypothetical protein ACOSQ4_010769 [Xanthoceras sorbifolium]
MVSFLKTVTGSWDSELVHCSFHADEADAILSILSTCHFVADSICWHYDSRGLFSVKNGYRIAISSADKPSDSPHHLCCTSPSVIAVRRFAANSPHHLCCTSPSVIAVRRFTDHLGFTAESSRRGKLFVKLG